MQRGKYLPAASPKPSASMPSSVQSIEEVHTESMLQEQVSPAAQPSTSMESTRNTSHLIKLVEGKKQCFIEMSIASLQNCKTAIMAGSKIVLDVEDYKRRKRLGNKLTDRLSNIYYQRMFDTAGYILKIIEMKSVANSYTESDKVHVTRMFFIVFQTMAIIFHLFEQHFQTILESGMPAEFKDFLDSIPHICDLYKRFTPTKSNNLELRLEVLVNLCHELENIPPAASTSQERSSSKCIIPKPPRASKSKSKKSVTLPLTPLSEREQPLQDNFTDLHNDDDSFDTELAEGDTFIVANKLWKFAKCFFNMYSNCPQEMSKADGIDIISNFLCIVGIPEMDSKDEVDVRSSLILSFVLQLDIKKMNFDTFMDNLLYKCDELTTVIQRLEDRTFTEGAVPALQVKESHYVIEDEQAVVEAPHEVKVEGMMLDAASGPVPDLQPSHIDLDHNYGETKKIETFTNITFAKMSLAQQRRLLKLLPSDILMEILNYRRTKEYTTSGIKEQPELTAFLNANKDLIKEVVVVFAQGEEEVEDMLQQIYGGKFH